MKPCGVAPTRYAESIRAIKRLCDEALRGMSGHFDEIFGWQKTTGGFRKSRYRSVERTHAQSQYVIAAWDLVRMAKLLLGSRRKKSRA